MKDNAFEKFKCLYDEFIANNNRQEISNDVESRAYELILYWLTPKRAKLPKEKVKDPIRAENPNICTQIFFLLNEKKLLDHLFLFYDFKENEDEGRILDKRQAIIQRLEQAILNYPEFFQSVFSDYKIDDEKKTTSIRCEDVRNILLVELLRIRDAIHVLSSSEIAFDTIVHNLMVIYSIVSVNIDTLICFMEHVNPSPDWK